MTEKLVKLEKKWVTHSNWNISMIWTGHLIKQVVCCLTTYIKMISRDKLFLTKKILKTDWSMVVLCQLGLR